MIRQLTSDDYEDFVRQKRAAAVHFDAEWDVRYKQITYRKMIEAAARFSRACQFWRS
jgi:hypothetical protein